MVDTEVGEVTAWVAPEMVRTEEARAVKTTALTAETVTMAGTAVPPVRSAYNQHQAYYCCQQTRPTQSCRDICTD